MEHSRLCSVSPKRAIPSNWAIDSNSVLIHPVDSTLVDQANRVRKGMEQGRNVVYKHNDPPFHRTVYCQTLRHR